MKLKTTNDNTDSETHENIKQRRESGALLVGGQFDQEDGICPLGSLEIDLKKVRGWCFEDFSILS